MEKFQQPQEPSPDCLEGRLRGYYIKIIISRLLYQEILLEKLNKLLLDPKIVSRVRQVRHNAGPSSTPTTTSMCEANEFDKINAYMETMDAITPDQTRNDVMRLLTEFRQNLRDRETELYRNQDRLCSQEIGQTLKYR